MNSDSDSTERMPAPTPLTGTHPRHRRRAILRFWIDNRWSDWLAGIVLGVGIRYVIVPHIHLGGVNPAIRFSVYAAAAAGLFAFVAIAFTPLAILTALSPGKNLERLRTFDSALRSSFLSGTLVLFLCAFVLIGCGAADTGQLGNSTAELIGSLAVGVATMKVLRLTELFAAILGASSRDTTRLAPERQQKSA